MFWLNHSQNNCHLDNKQKLTAGQRQRRVKVFKPQSFTLYICYMLNSADILTLAYTNKENSASNFLYS